MRSSRGDVGASSCRAFWHVLGPFCRHGSLALLELLQSSALWMNQYREAAVRGASPDCRKPGPIQRSLALVVDEISRRCSATRHAIHDTERAIALENMEELHQGYERAHKLD